MRVAADAHAFVCSECRSCAHESENRCDGLVRPLSDEEAVLLLHGTHSADRETVVHPQGFNGPSSEPAAPPPLPRLRGPTPGDRVGPSTVRFQWTVAHVRLSDLMSPFRRLWDRGPERGAVSTSQNGRTRRSEEHTSELQSRFDLVCR